MMPAKGVSNPPGTDLACYQRTYLLFPGSTRVSKWTGPDVPEQSGSVHGRPVTTPLPACPERFQGPWPELAKDPRGCTCRQNRDRSRRGS